MGAGILGTGGGGNPYIGKLRAQEIVRQYGNIKVIQPNQLKDDDLVICLGGIGAPTVGVEKVRGDESARALNELENYLGKKATAVISGEIGGSNSLEPIIAAGKNNIPMIDGDGMGRAFPEIHMKTFFIYGVSWTPAVVCDEKGNTALFTKAISAHWLEKMARAVTIQMGCAAVFATAPMNGNEVKNTAIHGTLTLAKNVGEAVQNAQNNKTDPVNNVLEAYPGKLLFEGKISDLARSTTDGFARGHVLIEGSNQYKKHTLKIEFQNENLMAYIDNKIVCMVPDLICIIDSETGDPITTELLRYGFRVSVLALPAPKNLCTQKALEVVGPKGFGYDFEYEYLLNIPRK